MRSEKQCSKQQLISSLKFIYKLLKYELSSNEDSIKVLLELSNDKFPQFSKKFEELRYEDIADKDYTGKEKIHDDIALNAIERDRYKNTQLMLFRNFLLLLIFARSLYQCQKMKPKRGKPNKEYEPYPRFPKEIFEIIEQEMIKGKKVKKRFFDQNIENKFSDFIDETFETLSHDIHFNFLNTFERSVNDTSITLANISKFVNAFNMLLTRGNQAIVSLFFEVFGSEFGDMDIPQSMMSFLRYYVYNDALQIPSKPKIQSLYVTGVGTNSIVAKFIGDIKGSNSDAFKNEQLELATDDNNPISKQIRIIYNRLLTNQTHVLDKIKNYSLFDSVNLHPDTIISIVPKTLDLFTEREAIEKYPFYPKHQICMYVYYNKVIAFTERKSLMIVPISFICTNAYSTKLFAEDIALLDNGNNIDRNDSKIKSASYQDFLHHYRMGKVIEQRKIKKIMLLPKGMFYHTDEQCVLIELTKEENSGIQFIDITNVDNLIERNGNFVSINNNPRLKHIYDAYNVPSLLIDTHGKFVNETAGNAIMISKYVSYNDVIQSSNLLPTYHLKHQHTNEDEQRKDITEYFDVIKLQKFTIDSSNVKGENVDVGYFAQSEFSQYGITSNDELTNIVKTKIKKDNKRVDRLYRVYNNDILIYVHYKDRKDMTMIQINNDDICIGMHNLIAIRLKEQYQKQDGYAKALFLWLVSDNGQEALKSITKTNTSNRPLISIDDLKMLQVDMSVLDDAKKRFNKIMDSIKLIKKQINELHSLMM